MGQMKSFTKLDVIKIAAELSIVPTKTQHALRFNCIPPFTIMHGGIVYLFTTANGKLRWHVFEEGDELPIDVSFWYELNFVCMLTG